MNESDNKARDKYNVTRIVEPGLFATAAAGDVNKIIVRHKFPRQNTIKQSIGNNKSIKDSKNINNIKGVWPSILNKYISQSQ